jgi:hypothetical protein
MPDFTDQDKETLDRLRKAFEGKAFTTNTRQPWQELLDRETSVSVQATLAADVVAGFSGSWASSYNYGYGTGTLVDVAAPTTDTPVPVRAKRTKLGQRGVPDIDFVPYNWRTNRFGSKGPSLVGHPISFTVVGPTLKSPFCDWTWEVELGAGPNGGDLLSMSTRPDGGVAVATTILGGYNVVNFTIGNAAEPNGGLYVLITDDGSNPGGIPGGTVAMAALTTQVDTARYELFRVSDVRAGQIELHPSKPLSDYFDLPGVGTRSIRAITLVQPFVTRLSAVPGSGPAVGRERSFVFVSPGTAAASDLYPPYDGGVVGDGTWLQGGFEDTGATGDPAAYGGPATLPVPKPIREGTGRVEKDGASSAALGGQFILLGVSDPSADDVGRVLHIYQLDSEEGAELTLGTRAQALGWFEVLTVTDGDTYTLARVAEVQPTDGAVFFGPGPAYISIGDPQHYVYFTVHEPVSSLWEGSFDLDAVEAARLRNLIDPVLVERARKQLSDMSAAPLPAGATSSRSDRAIFDTRTNLAAAPSTPANPGSLLDLGFRVVLFPARADGTGNAVPDYNRPIVSRDLVIDPSVAAAQTFEIDYAGGILRLSHAPPSVAGGSIVPNGIVGALTNNPRGEVVLFAACVPYSMEASQLGGGARVTGGLNGDEDIYSERIVARIDTATTVFAGAAPYFGAGGIVLTGVWDGPPTGVVDILAGSAPTGVGFPTFGTWAYDSVSTVGNVSTLLGISSEPTVADPTPGVGEQRTVVLRREVFYGQKSLNNSVTVDDYRFDSVYGSSQRAAVLRFPNANLVPQPDGSVQVALNLSPQQFAFQSYQWGYLTAAAVPAANASSNKYYSETGFLETMSYQDNANPTGGSAGGAYAVDAAQGPRLRLASLIANGDFKGAISNTSNNALGVVNLGSYTRLVTKFTINASGEAFIFFTGLIGTSSGATTPSVDVVTSVAAPPADIVQVGLRVYGPLNQRFVFFGLGSGGATSRATGVDSDGTGVYHFVVETRAGSQVFFGLFDANFQLLVEDSIVDPTVLPVDANGLYVVTAIRKVSAGVPRVNLDTWFTHVVSRYDLSGPPLLGP